MDKLIISLHMWPSWAPTEIDFSAPWGC